MNVDLDLTGHAVAVLGPEPETARAVARYRAAGADVDALTSPGAAERYVARGYTPALVVDVTAGADDWADALSALRRTAPVAREEQRSERAGTVTLVGAGPGDPALHTVAARDALAAADVVLVDRLADDADLAALAPAARVVDVGKTPGHHRVPQAGIERLLLEHAGAGAHVVRLKGGDPFVFGRGHEEVVAAREAGVPVRVVPGISSAIAVPAAAGIPVTRRGASRAFTVVSGHDPLDASTARGLVETGGTVVLLMAMATLPQDVAELRRAGLAGDTPVAVVHRGCTPAQRELVTTLDDVVLDVTRHGLTNPSVVVIGEVAALADAALDTPWRGAAHLAPVLDRTA